MNNATEYADSLTADIQRMTDHGAPFGLNHLVTVEWTNDETAYQSWLNDEDPEWEEASALDWLNDVLDIQYLVNGDRTYRAARILIAFGGPTAWIDTRTGNLEAAWWSATEYRALPDVFINGLDDALAELWQQ